MLILETLFENKLKFKKEHVNKIIKDKLDTLHQLHKDVQLYKDTTIYYTCYINNKLVGLLPIDTVAPDNRDFFNLTKEQLGHDVEVLYFWVDEEYRKLNIGKKLLESSINDFKDKYIGLGTGPRTSEPAYKLYKQFKFKIVVDMPGKKRWWLRWPD